MGALKICEFLIPRKTYKTEPSHLIFAAVYEPARLYEFNIVVVNVRSR